MIDDDPTGLGSLRQRFPAWRFTATWIAAATGPDTRLLRAHRGALVLTARTADAPAAQIEQAGPARRGRGR